MGRAGIKWTRAWPHGLVVLAMAAWVVAVFQPVTGWTRLGDFGSAFQEQAIPQAQVPHVALSPSPWGYDGQFYAQLATDPLLLESATATALDEAGYRARRIFLSALAYGLAFGQPTAALHLYVGINLLFWLALAVLLWRWVPPRDLRSFLVWWGIVCGLGTLDSVRLALVDLPLLVMLLLALWAVEARRLNAAASTLAMAVLTRETGLLALLMFPRPRGLWQLAKWCLIAGLPLLLWVGYLAVRGFPPSGGHGANFAFPLSGWAYEFTSASAGLHAGRTHNAWALLSLVTQCLYLLLRPQPSAPVWRLGVGFIGLSALLGVAVWEGEPGAAYRVLVPITLAFNLLLLRDKWFYPWWFFGNFSLFIGLDRLIKVLA